jgi:chitin disaccharide deacetylase
MIKIRYIPIVLIAAALLPAGGSQAAEDSRPLVERLGFAPETKVLILNADDFGMNHATNQGTIRAFEKGGITSATIMVPCPWFPEAAAFARKNPETGLGVHLTHTSEWSHYRWGPVLGPAEVPGLCDELGFFHHGVQGVYLKATGEEAEREARAQIDRALKAGVDVSHIDSHMGTMQYAPGYHKIYINIAKDYNLPCRIAGRKMMEKFGAGYLIAYADERGVLHPDELITDGPDRIEETAAYWKEQLAGLEAGKVTEILIHCGELHPEMEATTGTWRKRAADTDFFASREAREFIRDQGIERISYRELRHLQRHGKPMPRR